MSSCKQGKKLFFLFSSVHAWVVHNNRCIWYILVRLSRSHMAIYILLLIIFYTWFLFLYPFQLVLCFKAVQKLHALSLWKEKHSKVLVHSMLDFKRLQHLQYQNIPWFRSSLQVTGLINFCSLLLAIPLRRS